MELMASKFGDKPQKGVYFQVQICFSDHPLLVDFDIDDDNRMLSSNDLYSTYGEAYESAMTEAENQAKQFQNCRVEEMDPDELEDTDAEDFMFAVICNEDDGIISMIGVSTEDYRGQTIH